MACIHFSPTKPQTHGPPHPETVPPPRMGRTAPGKKGLTPPTHMPAAPEKDPGPRLLDQHILRKGKLHGELTRMRLHLVPAESPRKRQPALVFHLQLCCSCDCLARNCATCAPRLQLCVTAEALGSPAHPAYREAQPFIRLSNALESWSKPTARRLSLLRNYLLRQRTLMTPCARLLREGVPEGPAQRNSVAAR